MPIKNVLAEMPVKDFIEAVAWYEQLLDRPADTSPMEGLVEWHLSEGGGLQVFHDKNRAGATWVTFAVISVDDQLAELKAKGIATEQTTTTEFIKTVTITDPDGNHITFAETLTKNK